MNSTRYTFYPIALSFMASITFAHGPAFKLSESARDLATLGMAFTSEGGSVVTAKFSPHLEESLTPEENAPQIRNEHLGMLLHFPELKSLTLYDTWITDAGLATIRKIPELQELRLGASGLVNRKTISISDEGMKEIGQMVQLKTLELNDMRITDTGIERLTALRNLDTLVIRDTLITDDGVKYLSAFDTLKELRLEFNEGVSGEAVAGLVSQLPNLRILFIGGVEVTDPLIRSINECKFIDTLIINHSEIEDIHINKLLPAFKKLKYLSIQESRITDDGLLLLKSCKKLDFLRVQGSSKITDAGVCSLRLSLPDTTIYFFLTE